MLLNQCPKDLSEHCFSRGVLLEAHLIIIMLCLNFEGSYRLLSL